MQAANTSLCNGVCRNVAGTSASAEKDRPAVRHISKAPGLAPQSCPYSCQRCQHNTANQIRGLARKIHKRSPSREFKSQLLSGPITRLPDLLRGTHRSQSYFLGAVVVSGCGPAVVVTERGPAPAEKGEPSISVSAPLVPSMLYAETLLELEFAT